MTDVTNRTRHPSGVPTGGEFATEAKGENDNLPTPLDPHDSKLRALAPTHPIICQAERGMTLTDVQLSTMFEGGYRDVDGEFREQHWDLVEEGHRRETEAWLDRAREAGLTERTYDDLDDEEIEAFDEYLDERDDSDPVMELVEGTGEHKLIRALIGMPDETTWEKPTDEQKTEAVRDMLAKAGLSADDQDLREFIEAAPWGKDCQLDVVWYDMAKNAMPSIIQGDRTEIDLNDPYVTLVNGKTGDAAELKTYGTRTIKYPQWEATRFDENDCQDVPFIDGAAWGKSMDSRGELHEWDLEKTARRRDFTDPAQVIQSGQYIAGTQEWGEGVAATISDPQASDGAKAAAMMKAASFGKVTWNDNERDIMLGAVVHSMIPKAPRQVAKSLAYQLDYAARGHRVDSAESQRTLNEWAAATGNAPEAWNTRTAWNWRTLNSINDALKAWS